MGRSGKDSKMAGRPDPGRAGFTLIELITVIALTLLLSGFAFTGIFRWQARARFAAANDAAESIYYAAGRALTGMKTAGTLSALQRDVREDGAEFALLTGVIKDQPELDRSDRYVAYEKGYEPGADTDAKARFYRQLKRHIADGVRLRDALFIVELDVEGAVVHAVFYTEDEETNAFTYDGAGDTRGIAGIQDRSALSRRRRMIGYYGGFAHAGKRPAPPAESVVSLPESETDMLVNDKQLYLRFRYGRDERERPEASYHIELHGASDDGLLLAFDIHTSASEIQTPGVVPSDMDSSLATSRNLIRTTVTSYVNNPEGDTLADCPFLAWYADGEIRLSLDLLDTGYTDPARFFDTKDGYKGTLGIWRFGLSDREIYATVFAYEKNGTPTSAKADIRKSNIAHTLFGSGKTDGETREYTIENARHLHNIRYMEEAAYRESLTGKKDVKSCRYIQTADIVWYAETNSMFAADTPSDGSDRFMASQVFRYENAGSGRLQLYAYDADTEPRAFPAIGLLGSRSTYSGGDEDGTHVIEYLALRETDGNTPLGLFAYNHGTVTDVYVRSADVSGISAVGAVCGINEGRLYRLTVSGDVMGGVRTDYSDDDPYDDPDPADDGFAVGGICGLDLANTYHVSAPLYKDYIRYVGHKTANDRMVTYADRGYETLTNYASVSGNSAVGGIIGYVETLVDIADCANYGNVHARSREGNYIGGIVGWNALGQIKNCVGAPAFTGDAADIRTNGNFVGGIVGLNTYIDYYNSGKKRAGRITASGTRFYAQTETGARVPAAVAGGSYVGGIAGMDLMSKSMNYTLDAADETGTRQKNAVSVIGEDYVGGIVGSALATEKEGGGNRKPAQGMYAWENRAPLANWINTGFVFAKRGYAGGIAGMNAAIIENCINENLDGRYVDEENTVFDADGTRLFINDFVASGAYAGNYAGGVAGKNIGIIRTGGKAPAVHQCFVYGGSFTGGIAGDNTNGGGGYKHPSIDNYAGRGSVILGRNFVGGAYGREYSDNHILSNPEVRLHAQTLRVSGDYFTGGVIGGLFINGENVSNPGNAGVSMSYGLSCTFDNPDGRITSTGSFTGGLVGLFVADKAKYDLADTLDAVIRAGGETGVLTDALIETIDGADPPLRGIRIDHDGAAQNCRMLEVEGHSYVGGILGYARKHSGIGMSHMRIGSRVGARGVTSVTASYAAGETPVPYSFAGAFTGYLNASSYIEDGTVYSEGAPVTRPEGDSISGIYTEKNDGVIRSSGYDGAYETKADRMAVFTGTNNGLIHGCDLSGTLSGGSRVGGFAISNAGTISESRSSGRVSGTDVVGGFAADNTGVISKSTLSGQVTGGSFVGGIAGTNGGTITNASMLADESGQAAVLGEGSYIGGITGQNQVAGLLTNCQVSGGVNMNTGTRTYYRGSVVGGLTGRNEGEIRIDWSTAFVDQALTAGSSVAGAHTVGGIAGINAGRIRGAGNYDGGRIKAAADILAESGSAGGIAGVQEASGSISYAQYAGKIRGVLDGQMLTYAGGIAGFCEGNITGCVGKDAVFFHTQYYGPICGNERGSG